jgi:sulfate transport system ATP-binding protein
VLPSNAEIFQRSGYQAKGSEVFLRPNDVIIELTPDAASVPAAVKRVIHLGWEIQAELLLEGGQNFMANLTREQFDHLNLQPLQTVYVKPKEARSFAIAANDYQI